MTSEVDLESSVAKTSAIVAAISSKLMGLAGQVADWNSAKARATAAREQYALAGLSGDTVAAAATKKAVTEQRVAEENLETLALAIPAARLELAAAEREAQGARIELAQFHLNILKRQRVDAAFELDAATAAFERAYRKYQAIGDDIVNTPDAIQPSSQFGMTNHDAAIGLRRVRASLPKFVQTLYPGSFHDELKPEPLAVTEARFWNLPEQPDDEKKAA